MRKQDIRTYTFSDDDRLFFDANIWLYIYGPLLSSQNVAISSTYATALQKIRNAQSHLFIDALALSEFINTYARLEYRQSFANTYPTFKKFRKSPDFKSVAQDIANNAKRIVRLCKRCDLPFSALSLMDILDEYAQGTADYNDQLIAEICLANDFILVTHDADFLQLNHLSLLTANQRLLNAP